MALCVLCPAMLQRTPDGDLAEGVALHVEMIHPDLTPADQALVDRQISLLRMRAKRAG